MKSALRKLFAASFAAFLLCCGTDDSSKGAGELCNASTECKKGLTCLWSLALFHRLSTTLYRDAPGEFSRAS